MFFAVLFYAGKTENHTRANHIKNGAKERKTELYPFAIKNIKTFC